MVDKKKINNAKATMPLNMNGLRGRMLHIQSKNKKNKKEILIIYGQKSTLERWQNLAEVVSQYGNVIVPDLPGFGGMTSFYKINQNPTISNYADYLAAFIKLKYSKKRLVIIGISYGFVIVTKMLQEYPELANKVDLLFSVSSLAHEDDLKQSYLQLLKNRFLTKVFSNNLFASIYKKGVYHPQISKIIYRFKEQNYKYYLNQQKLTVRRRNDIRTQMFTSHQILHLDNCKQQVNLAVYAINGINDQHLYNERVEQHYRIIFSDYKEFKLRKHQDANYDELNMEELLTLLPSNLKKLISRYSNS